MEIESCKCQGANQGTQVHRISEDEWRYMLIKSGQRIGSVVELSRYLYEKEIYQILIPAQVEDSSAGLHSNSLSLLNHKSSPTSRTEMDDPGPSATPSLLPRPQSPEAVIDASEKSKEVIDESPYHYKSISHSSTASSCDYSQVGPRRPLRLAQTPYGQWADRIRNRSTDKYSLSTSRMRFKPAALLFTPDQPSAYMKRPRVLRKEGSCPHEGRSEQTMKSVLSVVSIVAEILTLLFLMAVGYLVYKEMVSEA